MESLKTKLELVDGIKSSKIEDKIAKKVTKFYTNKPFPNYKIDDDKITISKKGNNKEAINFFLKTLKLNPNHIKALNNIGLLYIDNNNYELAFNYLKKAICIKGILFV